MFINGDQTIKDSGADPGIELIVVNFQYCDNVNRDECEYLHMNYLKKASSSLTYTLIFCIWIYFEVPKALTIVSCLYITQNLKFEELKNPQEL